MLVREIMTNNPVCVTPETSVREAVKTMIELDCGALPVISAENRTELIGIVTDRDIVCRSIGRDLNPLELAIEDVMSTPAVSIGPDQDAEDCIDIMEKNMVRRLPVVEENGGCVGLVTQAQIARYLPEEKSGEMLRRVSQRTELPSKATLLKREPLFKD